MKVKQSVRPPVSTPRPLHGLVFLANCDGQEQSFSSCARTVCQVQIIVDFSQLQKREKKKVATNQLYFYTFRSSLSPADTDIYDLAQSKIIPAQNHLFRHFQFNILFSKSFVTSWSLAIPGLSASVVRSRVRLYYLDASFRTLSLAIVII